MKHRIAIYIPSESEGRPIEADLRADTLHYVADRLASELGGATAIQANGYWQDGTGKLILEPITIVYAFSDAPTNALAVELTLHVKEVLDQEACALEIDGELHLI